MNFKKKLLSFILVSGLILAMTNQAVFCKDAASQCIQCHTNLKNLIRLCWEVEKLKPKPGASSETSGEG